MSHINPSFLYSWRAIVLTLAICVTWPQASFARDPEIRISNVFYESELRQALMDVGAEAGFPIIASQNVSGYISCELVDLPLEKALATMLAGTGYVFSDMGDYIIVATSELTDPAAWQINRTSLYALNYLNAGAAQSMLPSEYKAFTAKNPDGHSLSITAPQQIIDEIKETLAIIDAPPRQIMLEARIVTMQSSAGHRLGMEYSWPGMAAGGIANGTEFLRDITWVTAAGLSSAGEISNALTVDMDFMISNDEASSVANPRVLASEGKEALISVMTEEYFKILTEDYYQRSTLEKVETGIQLKLTPRIGANDEITLDIETEVSDVISRGDDDLPVITRRKTTSKALVPNMGTVIISGLEDHRERTNTKKIPILGHIPLIGRIFSFEQSQRLDSQVMVMITPRIMESTAPNLVDGAILMRPQPPAGEEFNDQIMSALALVFARRATSKNNLDSNIPYRSGLTDDISTK
jgi:type II secretory pathway component GspD/PulD (secretin)